MKTSVRWINDYLDPPASADEQAEALTRAGLPFDGLEEIEDDVQQEIETTSNRGDCLCHLGMAREVAAMSGRRLRAPVSVIDGGIKAGVEATGPPAVELVSVRNEKPDECPLYTARVIRGATVGPSPEWLAERLRAIGQIPRNNVVDATNFVLFELGQPTHVFDLATLDGPEIIIRRAHAEEPFLPIGEGAEPVALRTSDLVIADARRAVAIAGVKGGAETAVTDSTTDLLIESATFAPFAVRAASRGLRIASDSSYRFERGVHPAQVDAAAERLVEILLQTAGGTLSAGSARDGAPIPGPRTARMRLARCRRLLGVDLPVERILEWLDTLGFEPTREGDEIRCTVPVHRLDVEREVDLVEEVARMAGLDHLPVNDALRIRLVAPQPRIAGRKALRDTLAGLGLVETVTHSLVGERAAETSVPEGGTALRVADERARSAPILRPSIIPSLLRVRRHNQDGGVRSLGLFESAAVFHLEGTAHREHESLGVVLDVEPDDQGLRRLRGVVERAIAVLAGADARVDVVPVEPALGHAPVPWLDDQGLVMVDEEPLGRLGMIAAAERSHVGLDAPVAAAEIRLDRLLDRFPPETIARPLPDFPPIERDISAIVAEDVLWRTIHDALHRLELEHLEAAAFVTVFRGKSIPSGRKSLSLRLRFRAPDRTLRHEEVEAPVDRATALLRDQFHAEIRG